MNKQPFRGVRSVTKSGEFPEDATRSIQVCKIISDSVQLSGGVVTPATDGVPTAPAYSFLRSAPASAALQRLSAGEYRSQDMCENVPRDANTLSAIFGYCSSDSLRATAKHYGVRILANSTLDETIRKAANCPEAPTMHVTRKTSKLVGIICEGDLFGPVEPASRFHGNTFMLVIAVITKKSPAYLYVYGLRSKRDVHHGLNQFFIDMLSHGVEISAMITDSGSEFRGPLAREVFARQGVYHEQRAPNRHALRAEGAIKRIYLAVRASLLDAGAPPDVWDRAVVTAVDAINCRINPMYTMSAHEALFGYKPDLVPLLPFLCWVSIKESRDRPRFSPDTRPFRYFGPARSHGAHSIFAGATADAIGLRVVHCFKYLAPASARIDPDTFRPYANLAIAPTASTVGGPPQNAPPPPPPESDDDDRPLFGGQVDRQPPATVPPNARNVPPRTQPPRMGRGERLPTYNAGWTISSGRPTDHALWRDRAANQNVCTDSAFVIPEDHELEMRRPSPSLSLVATALHDVAGVSTGAFSWPHIGLVAVSTDSQSLSTTRDRFNGIKEAEDLSTPEVSLTQVLRRRDAETFFDAIAKENLENPNNFADQLPALKRVKISSLGGDVVVELSDRR